ncbi:MAG: hypothetical protein WCI79_00320 [Candidatus Saccharibacteria bacterium]
MNENVQKYCLENPEIADLFKTLNQHGIRWGIFAGAAASLLTSNRLPTDIDILVHNEDFNTLVSLFPDAGMVIGMTGTAQTSDSKTLHYECDNIGFMVGDIELDISSNLQETVDDNNHILHLTDLATDNRISITAPSTTVYITNPFDTIAIKSIMQRGREQDKFDFPDSQSIISNCNMDQNYINSRMTEISLTDREIQFLQKAGLNI